MRPGTALCLLALIVTGASLCNRRLLQRRGQQAPSLPPSPVRRDLSDAEIAILQLGRDASAVLIDGEWRLGPEEAARLAMAWPAFTPLVSSRKQ